MKLASPLTVVILSYYCAAVPASAADTTTYTYDALGRLTQSQVSGGVRSGVQQTYQHDAAGNRVYRNVLGPTSPRPSTVTAPSAVISAMGPSAALVANVAGTAPTGTVTFSIDGMVVSGRRRFLMDRHEPSFRDYSPATATPLLRRTLETRTTIRRRPPSWSRFAIFRGCRPY
jgi:hypothetical protein